MNLELKKILSKRWAKKDVNPLHACGLIFTLGLIVTLSLVSSFFDSDYRHLCLPFATGVMLAFVLVTFWFHDTILGFWGAIRLLNENSLADLGNMHTLVRHVRCVAIDKAISQLGHERGTNTLAIEKAKSDFDEIWDVLGPDGLELISDKKGIFGRAEAYFAGQSFLAYGAEHMKKHPIRTTGI